MGDRLEEKVVSFIDLGTNSVRLLVVRINRNYSYKILRRQKDTIRLGDGEFEKNILSEAAMDRAVSACRQYVDISRNFGAEEVIAVATSATREAKNRDELIRRMSECAGAELNVISGDEEARLIYLGISSGIEIGEKKYFFFDIGGGSTEVIVGDQSGYNYLRSLKLGAIRTTGRFGLDTDNGILSDRDFDNLCRSLRDKVHHVARETRQYNISEAYGSSGTIISVITAARKISDACISENGNGASDMDYDGSCSYSAGIEEIYLLLDHLRTIPNDEKKKIPGISPERADIILAGTAILYTVMKECGIEKITASERSLRDGMLVDYLSKIPGFPHAENMPVRKRSVRQLGRSCRIDERHAMKVSGHALSLFDSGIMAGIHNYSPKEREYLEYASYLHDIGQFLSFSGHQNHSYYVITRSQLLGFDQKEIIIIGLIAGYHRKRMPKRSDEGFSSLNLKDQKKVTFLSGLLRIAEFLERSHDERERICEFVIPDDKCPMIRISPEKDCNSEIQLIKNDMKNLKKAFGREIFIAADRLSNKQ
ncbi:Ppx/GppA phosphatase family protein [Methanoplanus limicola]|uniref:Ppx/GppA phosphatase n=1 Tax=Methanoplanus limicola DSM 2279 TaxID=937775 RepID=H1YY82_9EURY|nr:Ppx/GppA phosphatase family protein [Methanoplanus limicola]EHQ34177.1 Ppx/GppA phosphatase [Methanoplanus limicola DSM 2279]